MDENFEIDPLIIGSSDVLDANNELESDDFTEAVEDELTLGFEFGDEDNAPDLDFTDIYGESKFPFEPVIGFYISEGVGVLLLTLSTVYDYVDNNGLHDTFLWYMHLIIWGQNSFVWLLALIFDNALMR